VTTLTGAVFGVVPALLASNHRVAIALNEETRGSSGGVRASGLRSGLVVIELALSLILLVGASLLIASFYHLSNISPGFQPGQLIAAEFNLPHRRYPDQRAAVFFEDLFTRLRTLPGVQAVAATSALPFSGEDPRLDLYFENRQFESRTPIRAHPRHVSTDYLNTMEIPLIHGRQFTDRDNASAPAVVIINDAAARLYWPGEDPIGQRISLGSPGDWMEIVGVAGDVRHQALEKDPEPEVYIPQLQPFGSLGVDFALDMTVVVRTQAKLSTIPSALRAIVKEIDPLQSVGSILPVEELISNSVAPRRMNFVLVSAFAAVALALSAAGLYGVMSYIVTQRTREIGVRMALGATRRQAVMLVVGQAGWMVFAGIAIGVCGALWLTRWITSMLFGIGPADPFVYIAVSIILAVVAFLAAAIPSGRASRIDPLKALRES